MQTITPAQWNEALRQVVERAQADDAYRTLCLRDPRAALEPHLPEPLPAEFTIDFIDGRGADMTVVLPPLAAGGDELSSADLEQVSGGIACLLSCGSSCVATCLCLSVPTITGV